MIKNSNLHCGQYLGILVLLAVGCSPGTIINHSWKSPEHAEQKSHIFVAAISEDRAAKATVENQLVYVFKELGIDAISSLSVFRPDMIRKDLSNDQRELMLEQIRERGCDAILTIALIEETSDARYVPGDTEFVPAVRYNFYNGFYSYYNYYHPLITNSGYYTEDKTYFLETNLYDVSSKELLWTAQTKTYNPTDIESFAGEFSKVIIARLKRKGLLGTTDD